MHTHPPTHPHPRPRKATKKTHFGFPPHPTPPARVMHPTPLRHARHGSGPRPPCISPKPHINPTQRKKKKPPRGKKSKKESALVPNLHLRRLPGATPLFVITTLVIHQPLATSKRGRTYDDKSNHARYRKRSRQSEVPSSPCLLVLLLQEPQLTHTPSIANSREAELPLDQPSKKAR